jgi:hypothetical protein
MATAMSRRVLLLVVVVVVVVVLLLALVLLLLVLVLVAVVSLIEAAVHAALRRCLFRGGRASSGSGSLSPPSCSYSPSLPTSV